MPWGTFFRPAATDGLARGPDKGQNHTGDCSVWPVENFVKTSVPFWMVQIFSKTFASPKLIFHKTFANTYSFSSFPCGRGSKGEEKCGHTYVFQLLICKEGFAFFRHENQAGHFPEVRGGTRLFRRDPAKSSGESPPAAV